MTTKYDRIFFRFFFQSFEFWIEIESEAYDIRPKAWTRRGILVVVNFGIIRLSLDLNQIFLSSNFVLRVFEFECISRVFEFKRILIVLRFERYFSVFEIKFILAKCCIGFVLFPFRIVFFTWTQLPPTSSETRKKASKRISKTINRTFWCWTFILCILNSSMFRFMPVCHVIYICDCVLCTTTATATAKRSNEKPVLRDRICVLALLTNTGDNNNNNDDDRFSSNQRATQTTHTQMVFLLFFWFGKSVKNWFSSHYGNYDFEEKKEIQDYFLFEWKNEIWEKYERKTVWQLIRFYTSFKIRKNPLKKSKFFWLTRKI